MFADQWEIGQFVIEALFFNPDYVGVAPLMIGVAVGAGRALRSRVLAMKPCAIVNIAGDFLVTVET